MREAEAFNLETRVLALNPLQQLSLCKAVVRRRFPDPDAIQATARELEPLLSSDPDLAQLMDRAQQDPSLRLDRDPSDAIVKSFLLAAVRDADLAPQVAEEIEELDDDLMFVAETLAVGFVVSLILTVATTEVRFDSRTKQWIIIKRPATGDQIRAAIGWPKIRLGGGGNEGP